MGLKKRNSHYGKKTAVATFKFGGQIGRAHV